MPLLFLTLFTLTFRIKMSSSTATFTVRYQIPYPTAPLLVEWRTQTFATKVEAERMIRFYKSCGSLASFV